MAETALWIMLLTSFGIMVTSPFALALILLVVPGRKGRMRTEREVRHEELTPEQARSLYGARLSHEGFVVAGSAAEPLGLQAVRRRRSSTEVRTHADKTVCVEMRFEPDGRGVRVRAAAWMNDFIFYDTGEGRMVDLTLDRVLNADLDREPAPVVPNRSFLAMSAVMIAASSIATTAVVMTRTRSTHVFLAAVVGGAGLAAVGSILNALLALRQIRLRPDELRGRGIVLAATLLGALGVAAAAAAVYERYWAAIITAVRHQLR